MVGCSLVMVRAMSLSKDGRMVPEKEIFAAVDTIGCGTGNLVLVTRGANARLACKDPQAPVDMVIVGIIDSDPVGTD